MSETFAPPGSSSVPLHILDPDNLEKWLSDQPVATRSWVAASGFTGRLGDQMIFPDADGNVGSILIGWGTAQKRARGRFHLGAAARRLPEGVYHIEDGIAAEDLDEAALGWLLSAYKFSRYKKRSHSKAKLMAPSGVNAERLEAIAAGDALTRDLINTPASDLGPQAMEDEFNELAKRFGAESSAIIGSVLLAQNLPMIHAVGRASDQDPRLLDLRWGSPEHPKVTLVGKGVCFDTGGLNIKPGSSMGLMKKDMGGGATVMGLAQMIMALNLPVRLRVLVPAVENSISAGAYRPQDILQSRKGLTVEINNTDAEGRLVLADALTYADEDKLDLLICMATLTGAARVAVGADISPFFTDDEALAQQISTAGARVADPMWRMPLWEPYEAMIEPDIADLDNAPKGGFAGSITAALFLRRFVENAKSFAHFDIYGWTPKGSAKGGACQGARALLDVISSRAAG